MAGFTNRGKYQILGQYFRAETKPTNLYIFLATSAVSPTADINTKSELTEIAAGNGYTAGGYQLAFNSTDWDTWTEDDVNDRGQILLKDISWTASTGPIPSSGDGARWAILTDDNGTLGSRLVYCYWDLVSDRSVVDGQTLTLQNCELRLTES